MYDLGVPHSEGRGGWTAVYTSIVNVGGFEKTGRGKIEVGERERTEEFGTDSNGRSVARSGAAEQA